MSFFPFANSSNVGNKRINLFFGRKECMDAIRNFVQQPLSNLTPEEDFITPFEHSDGSHGSSYQETIDFYKKLATNYGSISLKTMGNTDSGIPLYLVVYNNDGIFDFNRIKKDKLIILIANGSSPDEREPYTVVIPPPNVTGVLHMGHMLNNTIQDIAAAGGLVSFAKNRK